MKGELIEDYSKIRFPVLGSPKIDGFRCLLGSQAYTSRGKSFPNKKVHKALKGLLTDDTPLDGEIVVGKRRGPGVLQRTSSGVTTEEGKPDWRLWVFDAPRDAVTRLNRIKLAGRMVKELDNPRIRFIKHEVLHNIEELEAYIEACLKAGFEGVMISDPEGPYKQGKSTIKQGWLLKIKPFETHEAKIIGYYEEMENTNEQTRDATGKAKRSSAKAGKKPKGTLGGFVGVDTKTGVEVRCGGGFSAAQRKAFWKIKDRLKGEFFTYSKQSVGEKDKPRHANFCHLRPGWDLDEA
jgi:ATP-dependent DNA ligase